MRVRTIGRAVILTSAVPTVLAVGVVWVAGLNLLWAVPTCIAVFGATMLAARSTFRRYVAYRIKPLYQIVYSRSFTTAELNRKGVEGELEKGIAVRRAESDREIVRLKEGERYRKEFIGNVSHELKTPIFNIQGYVSTLLDGAIDDPSVNLKYLQRTERSVERMINIVLDLEKISQLESGTFHLEPEAFDIVALIRETVESFETAASSSGITLTVVVPPGAGLEHASVKADRPHIGQVLVNLISNSIRYGREGGTTRISLIDMYERVMVEVRDDGIGIAAEDQPRVFERFYRVDKARSRETGGTGLGLAIVKHIVEAHGETITLRSKPGRGSTFAFTLPKS